MSARTFRSIKSTPVKVSFSEEQVLAIARTLMEEHAAAREAATRQANMVCGNCKGAGNVASTLMPGQSLTCFACEGTGKPNDKVQSLPELTADDNERIWKIGQLLKGPHRVAVAAMIREYFTQMYDDGSEGAPN